VVSGYVCCIPSEFDITASGIGDCAAAPGVAGIIGILPVAMDCEESAFAGIDCEGVKPARAGEAEGFTV
jgi:hypothetical protein